MKIIIHLVVLTCIFVLSSCTTKTYIDMQFEKVNRRLNEVEKKNASLNYSVVTMLRLEKQLLEEKLRLINEVLVEFEAKKREGAMPGQMPPGQIPMGNTPAINAPNLPQTTPVRPQGVTPQAIPMPPPGTPQTDPNSPDLQTKLRMIEKAISDIDNETTPPAAEQPPQNPNEGW